MRTFDSLQGVPMPARPGTGGESEIGRGQRNQVGLGGALSLFFFTYSILFVVFLYGIAAGYYQIFPFPLIRDATKTLATIVFPPQEYHGEFLQFSDIPAEHIASQRMHYIHKSATVDENVLMFGGLNQYLDLCPNHGCLAVEMTPGGEVVHAYPYRPREIYSTNIAKDYPYEYAEFDPLRDTRPIGIERFPDGDLLVVFQISRNARVFPFGTGVARVDRQGRPRWFRFDYSHHWPSPIRGDELLVPALRIGDEPISFGWPDGGRETLRCSTGRPYHDSIRFLDGDGNVVREISVLEAILESPHAAVLQQTTDGCDPTHLNFIDVVRDDLPGAIDGIEPGDLVVSLRNISAFGIIDAQSGNLKRLVRGTFIQQHSVQHLSGSRFLLFDNRGGSHEGGPSRVLEVDLATGVERTVFPTATYPDDKHSVFSRSAGYMSISPDRARFIVNFSYQGTAFEVRLSDGKVLKEFKNLHDVSGVDGFAEEHGGQAAIFQFYGASYVPR